MLTLTYKLRNEGGGWYSTHCLNYGGIITQAKGLKELKRMAAEASELILSDLPATHLKTLKRKPAGKTFTLDFDPVTRKCLTIVP